MSRDADRAGEAIVAGDYAAAVRLLAPLAAADDAELEVLANYGAALQNVGEPEAAAASYRRAIELDPEMALLHYNLGSALGQAGDAEVAEAAYRRAIELDPEMAEAHGNLGVSLQLRGELADAEAALARAAELAPDQPWVLGNLAAVTCALGRYRDAEAIYRRAVELAPDSANARAGLAASLTLQGRGGDALAELERALATDPDEAEARRQLVAAIASAGDFAAGERVYRALLAARPDDPWAWLGLGGMQQGQNRSDEAEASFRRALEIAGDWADAHYNLGVSLEMQGRHEEAVAAYREAIARAPEHWLAVRNLAGTLRNLDQLDEARELYRRAAELAPGDEISAHLHAALSGETTARAPTSYISQVFDAYAVNYRAHMVDQLGYRAPEALRDALIRAAPERHYRLAVDLGCGTGLVGELLADRVDRWVGVDLSPGMLAQARAGGHYAELVHRDMIDYLADAPAGTAELVTSVDTLIYVGDLDAVVAGAARLLGPGGVFGFSCELLAEGDGFELQSTGRYAHSRAYLERLAADHGFAVRSIDEIVLRRERGTDVRGWCAVLER